MEIQSINFNRCGMFRSAFKGNDLVVPMHIHQCAEIVYVLKGELECEIADETIVLNAGDIAIAPPFAEHAFYAKGDVSLWLCVFSTDLLENYMPSDQIYNLRDRSYFTASEKLASFLDGKLPDTSEEMIPFNYYDRRKIMLILSSIYDEYLDASEPKNTKSKNSLLTEILLYLDEHYAEDLSINDLARALGYTPRHISRQIYELNDYNFRSLLNTFRIDHAKRMLRYSDEKLVNISIDCGFSNERSFFRSFLKVEGVTPTVYRSAVRKSGRVYKRMMNYDGE